MLQYSAIFNVEDKKKILNDFDPDKDIWVTSDIKSREFLLSKLKNQNSKTQEDYVIRAQDFWLFLLSSLDCHYQIVSRTALVILYEKWVASQSMPAWKKTQKTGEVVCQYLYALVHLLQHPDRKNLMREWFENFSNKKRFWKDWYELASNFWISISQKNIMENSWADVYLLDKTKQIKQTWRKLIFDLGFSISRVEVELIKELSVHQKVQLLIPAHYNKDVIYPSANIYRVLTETSPLAWKNACKQTFIQKKTKLKSVKFVNQLAEVKNITYEVSQALQRGIPANRIAVLAPHIEDYWTCLKSYFKKEKIAVNKKEVAVLFSFPFVSLCLAKMWIHLGVIQYENLEMILADLYPKTAFTNFRKRYFQVTEIQDIPSFCYQKRYLKNKKQLTSGAQFVQWARSFLKELDTYLEQPIKECFDQIIKWDKIFYSKLEWGTWLSLFEALIKNKEVLIYKEQTQGIHCLSFNAISWLEADYIYVAGLNEQYMKQGSQHIMSLLDADSLIQDIGFFVKLNSANFLEQTISHFVEYHPGDKTLSCVASNFYGVALNPSSLWLEKKQQRKELDMLNVAPQTTWDREQRKPTIKDILTQRTKPFPSERLIEQSLKEDRGEILPPHYALNSLSSMKHLSHSLLNEYVKCPFIFVANRLIGLKDSDMLDMDRSPVEQGSLVHALFQKIIEDYSSLSISKEQLLKTIDALYSDELVNKNLSPIHPVMKEKERVYLLKKAQQFLAHEKQRKIRFPNFKNKQCELKWEASWVQKNRNNWLIKGVMDRVDSDGDSYIVLDYKKNHPDGAIADNWENKLQFQLALYIYALESGANSLPALPVQGALFLCYKDFSYRGMVVKEAWGKDQFNFTSRSHSLISKEEKQNILDKVNQKINTVMDRIQSGDFTPNPKNKEDCIHCCWRHICRASHLN